MTCMARVTHGTRTEALQRDLSTPHACRHLPCWTSLSSSHLSLAFSWHEDEVSYITDALELKMGLNRGYIPSLHRNIVSGHHDMDRVVHVELPGPDISPTNCTRVSRPSYPEVMQFSLARVANAIETIQRNRVIRLATQSAERLIILETQQSKALDSPEAASTAI